ncbi:DMT family transporter [Planktotalea arctica]|uniref:DMT family transporter n=1 Tax=Planktotalea arctica TaxID=1481893 RepID=UPI001FE63A9A|nr:DMT family transporter [Planktotalea arctica]
MKSPLAPELRAAIWMIGSIVSFSFMAVAGRWLAAEYDTFEIMLYRSLMGVVVVFAFGAAFGTLGQITRATAPVQLVRNLFHFAGQNLWFFAITVIPLAQVFALEFTSPIWVLILSPIFLGERLTRPRVIAAVLGFIGILIVTRPGATPMNIGIVAAALSAICFAATGMLTKRLTRTESLTCILAYLTVTQLVFGIICAGYDGDIALPTAQSAPLLAMVGLAGLIAHLCLTKALSIAPATVVMPIDFTRLPMIAVIGMLVFGEMLDPWVFVGAALIFAGNYYNIWSETRKAQVSG